LSTAHQETGGGNHTHWKEGPRVFKRKVIEGGGRDSLSREKSLLLAFKKRTLHTKEGPKMFSGGGGGPGKGALGGGKTSSLRGGDRSSREKTLMHLLPRKNPHHHRKEKKT